MWWIAGALAAEVVNVGTGYIRVYAIEGPGGVVLVDAHYPKHEDDILRRLEAAGIDPDRVTALVLTHGHPDHAGSAAALAARLDVPVIAGALDVEACAAGDQVELHATGSRGRLMGVFVGKGFPAVQVDVPVADALDLAPYGVDAAARWVGGHTAGSLVVTLDDGRVISGDLIRGHLFRRDRPTLHFFHDAPVQAHDALRALIAEGHTAFLPAHGAELSAEDLGEWLATRGVRHDARLGSE
jgi:hydroxyacylglutathione hydrolase